MKLQLDTTIGFVMVETSGHYINIYTSEDSYCEGLINLWDYEKGEPRIQIKLSGVIREVIQALREYFPVFEIENIEFIEVPFDELLEDDAIERLQMRQNSE